MKRVGYLADKVFTRENVRAAWDAYNKNRPVKLRKAFDQRRADKILQAARRVRRAYTVGYGVGRGARSACSRRIRRNGFISRS